jgi:hypothetical protein
MLRSGFLKMITMDSKAALMLEIEQILVMEVPDIPWLASKLWLFSD